MVYLPRLIDEQLDKFLPHAPAIALEGAKGVGKTATFKRRAQSVVDLSDARVRQVLDADPNQIRHRESPVLVDEWQLVPAVWESVKGAVDDSEDNHTYLLTGSVNPPEDVRLHSGAGRILRMVLRPLAFCERGIQTASVSLAALLEDPNAVVTGVTGVDLNDYCEEIVGSGLPGLRSYPTELRNAQLDSYLDRIFDHDLSEAGLSVRRPEALRAWLTAYAAVTATTASWNVIMQAATPGESDKPSRDTVTNYREALLRMFVLDPLPAWSPSLSSVKRLIGAPKHHLMDPALAARLLGASRRSLIRGEGSVLAPQDGTLLGALFESLVVQNVRAIAATCQARSFHLRTRGGEHEVDIIVEGDDRRICAVEVKLSPTITDADVRHLNWLADLLGDRLVNRVIVTTGPGAYRRSDGVAVVPLALLGR